MSFNAQYLTPEFKADNNCKRQIINQRFTSKQTRVAQWKVAYKNVLIAQTN